MDHLQKRWDLVNARATEKKDKLEEALQQAQEFHERLNAFIAWLVNTEKTLNGVKPVSKVRETLRQRRAFLAFIFAVVQQHRFSTIHKTSTPGSMH